MTKILLAGAAALILAGNAGAQMSGAGKASAAKTPPAKTAAAKGKAPAAKGKTPTGPSGTHNRGFPINGDGNGPTNAMLPK